VSLQAVTKSRWDIARKWALEEEGKHNAMRWAAMAMAPPSAHNLAATEQMAAAADAAAADYTTLEPAPRGWDHGLHTSSSSIISPGIDLILA
jgi:hypothetical protein